MEWIGSLKLAINYIEKHLIENIGVDEVADAVFMSSFYFQKGFKILTILKNALLSILNGSNLVMNKCLLF